MKRASAARGLAALLAASAAAGCATQRPMLPPAGLEEAERGTSRLQAIQGTAWAPRRFKALYSAEISPKVGAVQRGFLSLFWDGALMHWRTSLPVAGSLAGGALGRDTTAPNGLARMLSGRLKDSDALAVLLGAPSLPVAGAAVQRDGDSLRFLLDPERAVVLGPSGQVTAMEFPGGVEARMEPGPDVPARIEVKSRKGRAILKLQIASPWPEGEPLPGGS